MRAESAGSFANRCSSSVNGVNEEWEQPKCAEMKEVPPHCLGCCSPSPPHRPHRRKIWTQIRFLSFSRVPAVRSFAALQHLLTQILFFLTHFAPKRTCCCFHTCPVHTPMLTCVHICLRLSSFHMFLHFTSSCAQAPTLAPLPSPWGKKIRCDTTMFAQEVKRFSDAMQAPRASIGWQVPSDTCTAIAHLAKGYRSISWYRHSSYCSEDIQG